MPRKKAKEFGKRRPPPLVTHRPTGPVESGAQGQKRSLAVQLVVMGAVMLGAYETFDWIDSKLNCETDPANPEELVCKRHGGSSYRRSRSSGWRWSSDSSSASSLHESAHGVSFGGFGHSGGGFSGGG